jgi:hypothetical protein
LDTTYTPDRNANSHRFEAQLHAFENGTFEAGDELALTGAYIRSIYLKVIHLEKGNPFAVGRTSATKSEDLELKHGA